MDTTTPPQCHKKKLDCKFCIREVLRSMFVSLSKLIVVSKREREENSCVVQENLMRCKSL